MERNLQIAFSQVRGQGTLGSCTAFAATAILEYLRNRVEGWYKTDQKPHYSPRFVWYNGRVECYYQPGILSAECPLHHATHQRDIDIGHSFWTLGQLMRFGACNDRDWSYNHCEDEPKFPGHPDHIKNEFAVRPTDACFARAQDVFSYLDRVEQLNSNPETWIREIMGENPIYITIYTNPSFKRADGLEFFDDASGLDTTGGHAVVLVGYNSEHAPDKNNSRRRVPSFLIRNSWGHEWGNQGYIWIAKDTLVRMLKGNPYVFRPKRSFTPLPPYSNPNQIPPLPPAPHAPGHIPGHVVPPGPVPQPTHPGPTPTPHHHGAFLYQWWLFDDKAQLNLANDDRNRWSPSHLARHSLGQKLDGPGMRADADYSSRFGLHTDGINHPNKGHPVFTDIETAIADPANHNKWVGLGACRLIEVPHHVRHEEADGFWKWTGEQIKGNTPPQPPPGDVKLRVIPMQNPLEPHPPKQGTTSSPQPLHIGDKIGNPDPSKGAVARPSGSAQIDFLVEKGKGKVKLGWVCYIQNEKDDIMDPAAFNLRVILSVDKKTYTYSGRGEDLGYTYNVFTTNESPSDMSSSHKIVFFPYLDIPATAEPGRYKIVLEIVDWEKGQKGLLVMSPKLGAVRPIDVNYIKFEIVP